MPTFKNNVVKVYEGENILVRDNNLLNEFKFDEIELMIKNKQKIEITFDLDVRLFLKVSVKKTNGEFINFNIENKKKMSKIVIEYFKEKIEKLNFDKNENKQNKNDIFLMKKEIEKLKQENKILKERNLNIIENEKITHNNYKNKIKILNNKLDDLIKKLNNVQQEKSKLKLELNELNIKYENDKKIIEEKIKIKNQEFNEITKDLLTLMQQKRELENQ